MTVKVDTVTDIDSNKGRKHRSWKNKTSHCQTQHQHQLNPKHDVFLAAMSSSRSDLVTQSVRLFVRLLVVSHEGVFF